MTITFQRTKDSSGYEKERMPSIYPGYTVLKKYFLFLDLRFQVIPGEIRITHQNLSKLS